MLSLVLNNILIILICWYVTTAIKSQPKIDWTKGEVKIEDI